MSRKSSLFGLGIPPAQYDRLITSGDGSMASVLSARLRQARLRFSAQRKLLRLAGLRPPLSAARRRRAPRLSGKAELRDDARNVGRVAVHHVNLIELLPARPAGSVDRFVLLDAQDWMTDAQLNALWTEITRTAASGARVIFRTADEPSLLPGRVSPALLDLWRYAAEESRDCLGSRPLGDLWRLPPLCEEGHGMSAVELPPMPS